jgi:raffinose/stachyose/melibiose transport system permease protein
MIARQASVIAAPQQSRPRPKARRNRRFKNWYFVLPAAAVYAFVVLIPIARGVEFAFTNWNGLDRTFQFVGIQNFVRLFHDPAARAATGKSVEFAIAISVGEVSVGLALALAVHSRIRGRYFFRVLFFAPVIVISVVVSYLWQYIFVPDGALNAILQAIGLSSLAQPWLGNETFAPIAIVIVSTWMQSGLVMAIFLAGLEGIPPEINDAAEVDGVAGFRRFWHVTLPLLWPSLTVAVVFSLIEGLKLFDQVLILTNGGPANSTTTLSLLMYYTTFQDGMFGYGSAMAIVLGLIVAAFASVQYFTLHRLDRNR